jgi:putative transposase
MNISTSVWRYRTRPDTNRPLHERIVVLAGQRRRFGYRRIHVLLKREGWCVNVKRVYRVYRNAGLAMRKRSRKRLGLTERVPFFLPEIPNHAWSMDFMHDGLADGRRIRCLNVVDDCTGRVSSLRSILQSLESGWRAYWIALPGSDLRHG